jgi:hypothetical protein
MKCLSIRQPWATLLVKGIKDVENREWDTHYRGPVLIHAAKKHDKEEIAKAVATYRLNSDDFIFGAIVGRADLKDIVVSHASPWFEGPYGWMFQNAEEITPVTMLGKPSLFDVDSSIVGEA